MADVVDETHVAVPENSMLSELTQAALQGLSEPSTVVKIVKKTEDFQAHRIKLAVSELLSCAQYIRRETAVRRTRYMRISVQNQAYREAVYAYKVDAR